jgi:collagenase-like PrtC family protease
MGRVGDRIVNQARNKTKMELLAPAGSPETFFAAVEAGADAVYLGLRDANARVRAKNFSLSDLETLIPFAHDQNVRVYITLNVLIKQRELPHIAKLILSLAPLKPDALIVQDLGVALLARRLAPEIDLHASTQMTIHNSAGAKTMADLGFARAILARECSLEEMTAISRKSGIGIEVFAHGALCYSYSGQCYFSSFLGGHSANRGRCAQPCRRSYGIGKNDGAYFSPSDLCLIDRLPEMAEAGVVSLKIEGRLKAESYVRTVVSSYREAIDKVPGAIDPALVEKVKEDLGRPKTNGYFDGKLQFPLINPAQTAGAGKFLGKVKKGLAGELTFDSRTAIERGDRLRVMPKFTGEREGFNVDSYKQKVARDAAGGINYHYRVPFTGTATKGDLVFLVSRKQKKKSPLSLNRLRDKYHVRNRLDMGKINAQVKDVLGEFGSELASAAQQVRRRPKRMVRAALPPGARDIIRLIDRRVDDYIVPLKHREIFALPRSMRNQIVLRVPVFIRERELGPTIRRLRESVQRGFTRFLIGNPAHLTMLKDFPEARIQFDYTFGLLNSAALLAMVSLGAELVAISIETDHKNLTDLVKAARTFPMELVAYGRPPLFTSRAPTPLPKSRGPIEVRGRDESETFLAETIEKLTIVRPKQPFAAMGAVPRHAIDGLAAVRLELSGNELQKREYDRLREAVTKWTPLKGVKAFNLHSSVELK